MGMIPSSCLQGVASLLQDDSNANQDFVYSLLEKSGVSKLVAL
jgi:hypothetical protein